MFTRIKEQHTLLHENQVGRRVISNLHQQFLRWGEDTPGAHPSPASSSEMEIGIGNPPAAQRALTHTAVGCGRRGGTVHSKMTLPPALSMPRAFLAVCFSFLRFLHTVASIIRQHKYHCVPPLSDSFLCLPTAKDRSCQ